MSKTMGNRSSAKTLRRTAVPLLALGLLIGGGPAATAAATGGATSTTATTAAAGAFTGQEKVITLPGATSAEGIAAGAGSTFYAGDLFRGDIYRGDIRRGTAELFIDVPEGRVAAGMKADVCRGLLFVAGGESGKGYIYNTRTGATVATPQLSAVGAGFINDVALTRGGAWFTDSSQAKLYFLPINRHGTPGKVRTLDVTGPAGGTSGAFNLNGIQATPDGKTLIVANTSTEGIYTVNPATGVSTLIEGIGRRPNADGLILDGRRLWVVQNFDNKIARFELSRDLSHGTLQKEITSPHFGVPTTAALFGPHLAAVNAHFDTGVPPTAPTYEVVVVKS
ncbi:SMP-30/gluconolactonase/LRE family protein [Streptomyces sp. NBC_01314]|uniref:SMP-30/gluconolactonase/LRE family protein n=1 Tax=Streptomyces sp. NBC_01314 TaxID=2903821 RepID=UPI00308F75F1|nr:SMP-30/gluconolactonase/LRE family protein [Streptomyces sp. NBC_01314]WRZ45789.1 SMP-30/gluconolactonase/LRE family protein [Streptomyces sp. NBC_01314]